MLLAMLPTVAAQRRSARPTFVHQHTCISSTCCCYSFAEADADQPTPATGFVAAELLLLLVPPWQVFHRSISYVPQQICGVGTCTEAGQAVRRSRGMCVFGEMFVCVEYTTVLVGAIS